MEWIWTGIRRLIREPVRISGLVMAFVGLGSAFGWWNLTDAQYDAVLTFLGLLLVVVGFFITPVSDPVLGEGQSVRLPDGSSAKVVKD